MKTKHQARVETGAEKSNQQVKLPKPAMEYKVVALRECPLPDDMAICESPEHAVSYWREHVESHPHYDPERECLVCLILNTRKKIKGHVLLSIGTRDTVLCSVGETFRPAIVAAGAGMILMHNHPSGESSPSTADIKLTREMIRAGQLLRLDVCDHIVMGRPSKAYPRGYASLKELGYFLW